MEQHDSGRTKLLRSAGFLKKQRISIVVLAGKKIPEFVPPPVSRSVTVTSISNKKLLINILALKGTKSTDIQALVNCGAEGRFIDPSIADMTKARKLKNPILVKNVDGTINKAGAIKHQIWIEYSINGNTMGNWFYVTALGNQQMILGLPWLREYNPYIDWNAMTMTLKKTWKDDLLTAIRRNNKEIPNSQELLIQFISSSIPLKEDVWDNLPINDQEIWIRAKQSDSQRIDDQYRPDEPETELPEVYSPWAQVFEKEASERFPSSRQWDHKIELDDSFTPQNPKPYPLSPTEQNSLDEWISEQTSKGYIEKCESPHASPFFFVSKKGGALRPCQDYHYLNKHTVKNVYPLPLVADLMQQLKGSKYFTKLDLRWGYNNVRIKEGDEWKAAFKTNRGTFIPKVMFFGLCNSPATFQSMMDEYFTDYISEGWVIIYMDDILIFSDDLEQLHEQTKKILQWLQDKDLFLKLEKCKFDQTEVEFLDMIIGHNTVKMDPVKLAGIHDWPTPKTVKQVRSFLGFCNFYRKFIPQFSMKAQPLNMLTKKDKPWYWGTDQIKVFEDLKYEFS